MDRRADEKLSSCCQGCLPPKGNESFCFPASATPGAHWSILKIILACIWQGLQPKLSLGVSPRYVGRARASSQQQEAVLLDNEIIERYTLGELLVPKELNHKDVIALRKWQG